MTLKTDFDNNLPEGFIPQTTYNAKRGGKTIEQGTKQD